MEINSLKCNHCGANLDIDPKIKFFNCGFCGSSLAIKRSGNAIFTEVLGEIRDNTDVLLDQSDILLLEKEIERLDREWSQEREYYVKHDKDGKIHNPDNPDSMIGAVIGMVFFAIISLIFFQNFFSDMPSNFSGSGMPQIFMVILLISIIVFVINLFMQNEKQSTYSKVKNNYLGKRKKLLDQLEQAKER